MSLFREGVGDDAELLWVEPVTVERLVDALIAEGGEIVEAFEEPHYDGDTFAAVGVQGGPGRYLVYGPLPAEEETTT